MPVPADDELLLEVAAVGICGTDAAEFAHGPTMFPIDHAHPVTGHRGPMVPGHEFSGTSSPPDATSAGSPRVTS